MGLVFASLPFVLGEHNKKKLFLAMDWHCITRYMYRPDNGRGTQGLPPTNTTVSAAAAAAAHAPQEDELGGTILTQTGDGRAPAQFAHLVP